VLHICFQWDIVFVKSFLDLVIGNESKTLAEEMDNLIDKVIPELGEIGKSLGFISDDEIKKTLDKYNIPLETDMEHLNDKSFNRQRAVWMCHPAEVR
jgi:hypothetical protein